MHEHKHIYIHIDYEYTFLLHVSVQKLWVPQFKAHHFAFHHFLCVCMCVRLSAAASHFWCHQSAPCHPARRHLDSCYPVFTCILLSLHTHTHIHIKVYALVAICRAEANADFIYPPVQTATARSAFFVDKYV